MRQPMATVGPHHAGRFGRPATAALLALIAASLTVGCVGQLGRNDDHVGPNSPRPDAREHTMAPPVGET